MEVTEFNYILVERGDRVAIQGDGHPTMAAALVAFGSEDTFALIHKMLNQTNSGHVHGHRVVDDEIMAYPIYWTMSVMDWFWASGNIQGFRELVSNIRSIVDTRIADFLDSKLDIGWMGWDDRLGNGWYYHSNSDACPREAHITFAALIVRACQYLARSLTIAGMIDESNKYQAIYQNLIRQFRQRIPELAHGRLGVHAATNVISTGIANQTEVDYMIHELMNGSVTICSWSPFNQYWILQALGASVYSTVLGANAEAGKGMLLGIERTRLAYVSKRRRQSAKHGIVMSSLVVECNGVAISRAWGH
jgi:alpha-L-rhamnosidase